MEPIFNKKEVLSILNSKENYGKRYTKEESLNSTSFTEAVSEGEDIAELLSGKDVDVQEMLSKVLTIQESISKNIIFNSIMYDSIDPYLCNSSFTVPGKPKYYIIKDAFNYTNLSDTSIPRLMNLKTALDTAAEKLFTNGVSVGRTNILIRNQNDANIFYKIMKDTCKSIKNKKSNISAELFNDPTIIDSNDLSIKAYTYYRGGDVISRKQVKCTESESKTRKELVGKMGNLVKTYDDSCVAICKSLTNLVNKLSLPISFYNRQMMNQMEYLKNKLRRLFICYTVEYLYRANLIYAAHADAIEEYLTLFYYDKEDDIAVNNRKYIQPVDGDILANMESFISLDESFDDEESTADYIRDLEFFDGKMYNISGDYMHMNTVLESCIDEFYDKYIIQEALGDTLNNAANKLNNAANKATASAKASEATGDSNTRFRKIWAAFLNFMNGIINKFRGSMEQRIKSCTEFIDANQQNIINNAKIIPGTVDRPDYEAGLKLITTVKMPESKTVLESAMTGTLNSVEQIESSISFGGNNKWDPKNNKNSFVDYAKNMFITGGTESKTIALNSLNVQEMMKFCKDATRYNNIANSLKDDMDTLGNATTDALTKLVSREKADAAAAAAASTNINDNGKKEAGSTTPGTGTVGQTQTKTPNGENANIGFSRYDNIESFIETYLNAYGEEATTDTTSQNIKGVNSSGGGKTDFSKTVISASSNFQNALKTLHTSKLTAYEFIYVKYMEVLRVIANYNPNAQQNNNQQNNGNNQQQ